MTDPVEDPTDPTEALQVSLPHGLVARVFHWGFLAVVIFALTKQLDEVSELEDPSLLRYEIVFAGCFLTVLAARFLYMRTTHGTALPQQTSVRMRRLARAGHLAMYVFFALIAITGLAIGALYQTGIKTGALMDGVLVTHEIAVNTSYLLVAGHVLAALAHRRLGDGVWNAMVPFWREKR